MATRRSERNAIAAYAFKPERPSIAQMFPDMEQGDFAQRRNPRRSVASMINDLWYKNAVIYCLSVATYMDANGDGVGDFSGLMHRLDYLHGLGITAVWLMPFQCSPGRDGGYDIADYYSVDPAYGTLGDFVEFTHAAKQRASG